MPDSRLKRLSRDVEDLLVGYGQDLAHRNVKPGIQLWGHPELAVAVLAIVAWFLRTAAQPVIEASVKKRLSSKEATDLQRRVESLESIIAQLVDQHDNSRSIEAISDSLSQVLNDVANKVVALPPVEGKELDGLVGLLVSLGLTKRKAAQLAPRVRDVLWQGIARMQDEEHT